MIAVAVVLCATWVADAAQLDYPQWRGTNRDGAASGFVSPAAWPMALTKRWRAPVGEGYASPIVVGDTVFVFARRGEREMLTALDAGTGTERWQSGYRAAFTPSRAAAAHGSGPKATPLYQNGTVFTLGISGILAAFDARRGTLRWRTDEPTTPPFFSAASSPVGAEGLVLTHPGNYGPLTAFSTRASGAIRWMVGGDGFFMAPTVVTLAGVPQVTSVTQSDVIGVSIPDGRRLWSYPWSGGGPRRHHADRLR